MRRCLPVMVLSVSVFGACAHTPKPAAEPPPAHGPTLAEAQKFFADVDVELRRLWVAQSRADWVNQNFITDDTEALSAAASSDVLAYLNRTIKNLRRFDALDLPPDLARQRTLLRLAGTIPAPADPKERDELAAIAVGMQSDYGKAKYCSPQKKGKCLAIGELSNILADSRKYDELVDAWKGWHDAARPLRPKYARFVELANKGAKEIGFTDVGEMWRSGYDMSPVDFEADVERLWQDVKPLYDDLHCYVRARLRKQYGKDRVPDQAPIPAHLLGNMWAQDWANVYPLVEPYRGQPSLDVTRSLRHRKIIAPDMVKIAERFFVSLGMDYLPKTFWERSLLTKPADREVVCHASAWDPAFADDLRIKMCIEPKEEDLVTIHHELGHDYYYHSYFTLPVLYQQGANDGFHEGIGDTLALSITPRYLKAIGLIDRVPDNPKSDINFLMHRALEKVAFLPFGKLIDQWRWEVFSGKIPPEKYNMAWWELRKLYQGIAPPLARTEDDFDPGAKYHVPANTPYMRYFLAAIYQFQFHRALCRAAGHKGPLHTCSIYGSHEAGEKLKAMLALGASKPWPDAMEAITGSRAADASALLEYFEPLQKWLKAENKGESCGW
jgi:peptidyl-dipeptidase A